MRKAIPRFYEKDGCLWFHLVVPSTADIVAAPFEFDGPATEHHIKGYGEAYRSFVAERAEAFDALVQSKVKEALEVQNIANNGHVES